MVRARALWMIKFLNISLTSCSIVQVFMHVVIITIIILRIIKIMIKMMVSKVNAITNNKILLMMI